MQYKFTDDILLMQHIKDGDLCAFKYLFDKWFVPLCRFMHTFIQDKTDAEQMALDIFVTVWSNRDKLRIRLTFKAYLFAAARNKCFNYLRDKKKFVPIDTLSIAANERAVFDELSLLIEEAVCQLPPKCSRIFKMSRQEELSNKEIAGRLQISEKTVEAHITRALKAIRKYLGENYFFLW